MFVLPDALSVLTIHKNWVAWQYENREGNDKPAKVPYNPNSDKEQKAQPNNPATWGAFRDACNLAEKINGGIGFMFHNGCGYAGIDLDNVFRPDMTIKPFAHDIVKAMNSYTEISPSGHGLHILFMLKRPLDDFGKRRRNTELGLEIYDTGRYFTVTGNPYGEPKIIEDCTHKLGEIYRKYWPEMEKSAPHTSMNFYDESDSELLERMFNSPENGMKIRALFEGNTAGYNSQSEADLALCNHLAFWTRGDFSRIDALFRQSKLMREKWDERHGKTTYGAMTIETAIRTASERGQTYSQDNSYTYHRTQGCGAQKPITLDAYINSAFQEDIKTFKTFSDSTTGFSNLDDDHVRLYPGLYAVGGIPSVGKTTFCLQLADNIAMNGDFVVYFTLEQQKFDVVSKGITRKLAQTTKSQYVTAIQIRNGYQDDYVKNAISEYTSIAAHQVIVDKQFDISVSEIQNIVEQFIHDTGHKPVVFVDYLQALSNESKSNTKKDAIDHNVQFLKRLSTTLNIPVFVVSSFNRTNYLNIADFESFKESGGIEYTSDVVWALQLLAMNAQVFDKQNNLQTKRKFVQKAKSSTPRKIELITLKNRFGKSSARYFFDYFPAYEYFTPYDVTEDKADDEIQKQFDAFNAQNSQNENGKSAKSKKETDII